MTIKAGQFLQRFVCVMTLDKSGGTEIYDDRVISNVSYHITILQIDVMVRGVVVHIHERGQISGKLHV